MTDLIERLRDKAARFHRMHWKRDYEDISEAADEIERLRHEIDVQCSSEYVERILKEIERLKAELFTMRNVFHQQDAEIERLRAVVDAADAWSCAVAMKDVWATESDLHDALNKLREAGDE
jgi:predicted unusual protein kinase regulating ubiquinone biosynthesis (AarF/ABC1/UbiB family)